MIYTSYFGNIRNLPMTRMVSIAAKNLDWVAKAVAGKLRWYRQLAPSWDILTQYKRSGKTEEDWDIYQKRFNNEVLRQQNPEDLIVFLRRVTGVSDIEVSEKEHVYLLCYEAPGEHCHRHLVASWLNNLGIKVEEVQR